MKKVVFQSKPTGLPNHAIPDADSWVENRGAETKAAREPQEAMKRLTIDVPLSLHKRIKSQCVMQELVMADVIRDLLEQHFPVAAPTGVQS